jgi:BirA family biotin operon repressor/biotin-[acetyl-CoA-carboxylase] ligase
VILSDEVDSTNRVLRGLAPYAEERLVVVANHQTQGRGRRDRGFLDEAGASLLVSSLHRLEGLGTPALLAIAAGGAATSMLRELGVPDAAWWWPNDVVIGDAKAGGLLIEATWSQGWLEAVVGFGLNLTAHPTVEGRSLTHVGEHRARPVDRDEALWAWLEALDRWLDHLEDGSAVARARALLAGRAQRVRILRHGADELEGDILELAEDGALVVRSVGGTVVEVHEGELVRVVAEEARR